MQREEGRVAAPVNAEKNATDRHIPKKKTGSKQQKEHKPVSSSMALDQTGRGREELDKTQTDLDDDKSQICNFDDGEDDEDDEAVFVTNRRSAIKIAKEK